MKTTHWGAGGSIMSEKNFMELKFASRSENESFARVAVAAFVSQLDPTMDELTDIKTVVSEAVTNAIIHGYDSQPDGIVYIRPRLKMTKFTITVEDNGAGIEDMSKPDSRFIRQNRNSNARVWGLP